jgi:hypothetical protein
LKHVFESLSNNLKDEEKNFYRFVLNNTVINQLLENTFEDITFENIEITQNSVLKYINTHAFTATNLWIKTFRSYSLHLENNPPDNDLFRALSLMNNLTQLSVYNGKLTEIPSNAFRPLNGPHKYLNSIILDNMMIKNIGDRPFWSLPSVKEILLRPNNLSFISSHAFEMKSKSTEFLTIGLNSNQLNNTSFEFGAFMNIQRPVELQLPNNTKLTYLDEKIFKAFLNNDPKNKILVNTLDCDDCKSNWLKENNKFMEQMGASSCSNENEISNEKNFLKCSKFD